MTLATPAYLALACILSVAPTSSLIAADYPNHAIRTIVQAGAGSAVDVIPRVVLDQLSAQLGQAIVVENRPGAGGIIATAAVVKSEADGYTLLATSSAHTVTPWIYSALPYDPVRDLTAIVAIGSLPTVLVTSPAKGLRTIQDFISAARAKPGSLNYTSTGVGSATHFSAERFRVSAGIDAVHVPTKGGPEALAEVISGRADFYFCPIATALPFIRDGKLLALVLNGTTRAAELPDVPTTEEAGLKDADYIFWIALFAPAKTPRAIVERLHDEATKAMETPSVRTKLAAFGVASMPMSASEFDAYVKAEIDKNRGLVRAAGIGSDTK
jgi:tripartite-type tricarboxylate transporter receptor subunit TctC